VHRCNVTDQGGAASQLILVFERFSVQIPPRIQATTTKVLSGIPQTLQAISGIVPGINQERFLQHFFKFIIH
jgi:hypothetical protein